MFVPSLIKTFHFVRKLLRGKMHTDGHMRIWTLQYRELFLPYKESLIWNKLQSFKIVSVLSMDLQ